MFEKKSDVCMDVLIEMLSRTETSCVFKYVFERHVKVPLFRIKSGFLDQYDQDDPHPLFHSRVKLCTLFYEDPTNGYRILHPANIRCYLILHLQCLSEDTTNGQSYLKSQPSDNAIYGSNKIRSQTSCEFVLNLHDVTNRATPSTVASG